MDGNKQRPKLLEDPCSGIYNYDDDDNNVKWHEW